VVVLPTVNGYCMKRKEGHLIWVVLLFILLGQGACQSSQEVDANEFERRAAAGNVQIIDVRTPEEFDQGAIPGAVNLNINDKSFKQGLRGLDKSKPVLVYCLSGGRSKKAATILRDNGFASVTELEGGIMNWKAAKKPLDGASGPSGITAESFQKLVTTDKLVLVDFHATWCGPCKKMAPGLLALADTYKDQMQLLKIDADENGIIVDELKVMALPTLKLYKEGTLVWSHTGFLEQQEIDKVIQANL
jgi:thioredoxin 1